MSSGQPSADAPSDSRVPSRPSKETNSVEPAEADFRDFDDLEELVHERVLEFIEEYPELADLPLSQTHGRKLRRIVTEAEWRDRWVDPPKPTEDSFRVTEVARRDAVTWADALSAFLTSHTQYDGLLARFANDDGETFEIPLADAWGEKYSKKQYARAMALQRQMAGGDRPTGGEAIAAWDEPATAMLSLTGSSIPGGDRLPPVEFFDEMHDSFSYNGVRDTLRNTMEYHLGLDADEWGYWLQTEPHGVGAAADPHEQPGANACYTHIHVGVYFDAGDLFLEDVGPELERVIDKHVEECEYAEFSGHDYTQIDDYIEESDGCISLNADVGNMGCYMATYMGGYTEDLLEKPIEYLAWGAIYWSAARRRTSRSQIVTMAIQADACEQRAEHPATAQQKAHGEKVIWNDGRGLDVVCSCCGSGWAIDQSQLSEPVSDSELSDALAADGGDDSSTRSLAERWPSAESAFSYGEGPLKTRIRLKLERWFASNPDEQPSLPLLLGNLDIDPRHADLVKEILAGDDDLEESFSRFVDTSEWELEAIIDRDGQEHTPGDGGVDMVELHLPVRHLLAETRLQHSLKRGEMYRCSGCNFATHNARQMANHFVGKHGLDRAKQADSVLKIEDYNGNQRDCMNHPARRLL